MSLTTFILDNYYILILFMQMSVLAALFIHLGRFDYEDPRTGAFRRVIIGVVLWAFFDFLISTWAARYDDATAFDLYRYSCFLFLVFPPAASELIIALHRKITWRTRTLLYGPYLALYATALAVPDIVSAKMFGVAGGAEAFPGPWNAAFKIYTPVLVFSLIARLVLKALGDADPVARREKLVLAFGGAATMVGILLSQIAKSHWPELPWLANMTTLTTTAAAFISLKKYGRVLSPQALYGITVQITPAGMIHLHGDRISWASPSMLQKLGYSGFDELANRPVETILAESDPSENTHAMIDRMSSGRISNEEANLIGADGNMIPCLISGAAFNPADPSLGALLVFTDVTEYKRIEREREKLISSLQDALVEVKTLRGFLPICANCKKIRDDEGYWRQIEEYIQDRSDAQFSHSICPDCKAMLYPDLFPPSPEKEA